MLEWKEEYDKVCDLLKSDGLRLLSEMILKKSVWCDNRSLYF